MTQTPEPGASCSLPRFPPPAALCRGHKVAAWTGRRGGAGGASCRQSLGFCDRSMQLQGPAGSAARPRQAQHRGRLRAGPATLAAGGRRAPGPRLSSCTPQPEEPEAGLAPGSWHGAGGWAPPASTPWAGPYPSLPFWAGGSNEDSPRPVMARRAWDRGLGWLPAPTARPGGQLPWPVPPLLCHAQASCLGTPAQHTGTPRQGPWPSPTQMQVAVTSGPHVVPTPHTARPVALQPQRGRQCGPRGPAAPVQLRFTLAAPHPFGQESPLVQGCRDPHSTTGPALPVPSPPGPG